MKNLPFLLVPVLLLVLAQTGVRAQSQFGDARTQSLSIRLDGGVSWAFASAFDQLAGSRANLTQPTVGVGVMWNLTPNARLGVNYNYSRMVREQAGTLEQLPGGGVQGDVYKDFKEHLNFLYVTAEYNVFGSRVLDGRLYAYVGTGLGLMAGAGSVYTLGIQNEILAGGAGNIVQVTGHNEKVREVWPALPFTLTVEYAFLPQVAVSLSGGYRGVFGGNEDWAPAGQAFATVGLVFNLHK